MSTDVNLLGKGLKYLGILIVLFIAAPISLTMGFKALKKFEDTPNAYLSYIILLLAIFLTIFAIYFAFKTFKVIQSALFSK